MVGYPVYIVCPKVLSCSNLKLHQTLEMQFRKSYWQCSRLLSKIYLSLFTASLFPSFYSRFFFYNCVVLLLKTENNNSGSWFQSHIDNALKQFNYHRWEDRRIKSWRQFVTLNKQKVETSIITLNKPPCANVKSCSLSYIKFSTKGGWIKK